MNVLSKKHQSFQGYGSTQSPEYDYREFDFGKL